MSGKAINIREFVVATTMAVILGSVISVGAVYGLNRIFDMYDAPRAASLR
jgi:hypothetical protein